MQSYRHVLTSLVTILMLSACTMPAPLPPAQAPALPEQTQPQTAPIQESQRSTTTNNVTPEQAQLLASLPSKGLAPELNNEVWYNSAPLKLADLRGKVVMVEFWTFDCINCKHVIPTLRAWHTKYADQGLVIIGVHSPEFDYEKDPNNVQAAIAELGVEYPVALDNDYATWRAYGNHYWPASYLIDKAGHIRRLQIGEGGYLQTEAAIQALLAESAPS
jgi:thiol-disulfide isomerase/thioredoxin